MVFKIFLPTKKFCRLATSTCRLCNPVVYVSPSIQVYQPPFFCKNLSTKYKQHTKRTKATSYHKQGYKFLQIKDQFAAKNIITSLLAANSRRQAIKNE